MEEVTLAVISKVLISLLQKRGRNSYLLFYLTYPVLYLFLYHTFLVSYLILPHAFAWCFASCVLRAVLFHVPYALRATRLTWSFSYVLLCFTCFYSSRALIPYVPLVTYTLRALVSYVPLGLHILSTWCANLTFCAKYSHVSMTHSYLFIY